MEQQAPGSPAEATEAGPGAAEGQGSQGASQAFPGAEGVEQPPLVQAILAGDSALLSELLAAASPKQLAATQPFSLYHAAAIAGNAKAVCMLHDAGVPPAAFDTQGTALGSLSDDPPTQQQLAGRHFTPLSLGAFMGHGAVVATMLRLGADPEAPSLDTRTQPASQLTPLAVVAGDPLPGSSEAVADLLLTVGADVAAVGPAEMEGCTELCPGLASLLRAAQQGPGGAAGAEADATAGQPVSALRGLTLWALEEHGLFPPPTAPAGANILELLPPYHRAVLRGEAHTVDWLHYVGLPAEVADSLCYGPAAASQLQIEPEWLHQLFGEFSGPALGLAARLGDASLVKALLAVGAAVDQPSPQVPGVLTKPPCLLGTSYRPATPLDVVACCSAEFGEQHTEALLQQLLAAGADVTSINRRSLFSCSRGPARLLMQRLQQASEEGQLPMSAEEEDSWYPLVQAAAGCDSVPALEHFLGRVLQLPLSDQMHRTTMPNSLLRCAAEHGSLQVLGLAAKGAAQLAASGAVEEGSVVARVLGPRFAACFSQLLESAAKKDQAHTVCLLLDAGAVPTAAPFRKAVEAGAMAAVCTLLSRGKPNFTEALRQPLQLPTNPRSMAYPCPILATLQTRLKRATFTRSGVEAVMYFKQNADAVHPWDAKLLPGLEALLDAGCRPRTFSNVLVSAHPDGPAQLRGQFDPLDPTDGDPGLDVKDLRLLALAIEHPDWSPATHRRFPRSFRAVAPTLLLVAHRGGTCGTAAAEAEGAVGSEQQVPADGAAGLAALPADLLHRIIGLAAYPLSAWAQMDAAATQAVFDANGWGPLSL